MENLPIGVFDSGLGGLTVLERLLDVDQVNNATGLYGPDGVPDLARERFVQIKLDDISLALFDMINICVTSFAPSKYFGESSFIKKNHIYREPIFK